MKKKKSSEVKKIVLCYYETWSNQKKILMKKENLKDLDDYEIRNETEEKM